MEKEKPRKIRDFGKIRDAAREFAETEMDAERRQGFASKLDFKTVFDYFRKLDSKDKEAAGKYIEELAAQRAVRLEMGTKRWQLFTDVAEEKFKEIFGGALQDATRRMDEVESQEEADMLIHDTYFRAVHDVEEAVKKDSRIHSSFIGEEDLLAEAIKVNSKGLHWIFEDMQREDKSE
ncbi:hypothetical protein HYW60_01030 [Candidatus Kaiserbacteria bacterium]|nr:hypothetical protein [Candidatus Kaiserbacteria bacterium]